MGSVKDLKTIREATSENAGEGLFNFSDRYSVFDWGEMPDTIPHKGAAIAILGAYFFEKLEKYGVSTHYKGLFEDSIPKKLSKIKKPSKFMLVDLYRVIKPVLNNDEYDYGAFQILTSNFLIPLEIIYRNSLPEGSSVFKRLNNGEITIYDLGLSKEPQPDSTLIAPIIDFSTKLEVTDKYLSKREAQFIADLDKNEVEQLCDMVFEINDIITSEYRKIGLTNLDGKIETAFNKKRELVVVDVFGTLDECRFELNGVQLSKEVARLYYRKSAWYFETERAKEFDRLNWKKECNLAPEPLPKEFKELISFMYCQVTNEITEKKWFDVPLDLNNITSGIKSYIN